MKMHKGGDMPPWNPFDPFDMTEAVKNNTLQESWSSSCGEL